MTRSGRTRLLGPQDRDAFLRLTGRDPVVNVFAEHRARHTDLDPRWLGAQVWGRFDGPELTAACHMGANLVPVECGVDDLRAFAPHALDRRTSTGTILGPREVVRALWDEIGDQWGPPRESRWNQPHLEVDRMPLVAAADNVRPTTAADFDALYPACVAMHTEELGITPEPNGDGQAYRTHVQRLVARGWSFASFDSDGVVFKAEIVCQTPYAAQLGGVWVRPDHRGEGLAAPGVSAVVAAVMESGMAPVVSLYVNDWNQRARATYATVGFRQTATLATLMF